MRLMLACLACATLPAWAAVSLTVSALPPGPSCAGQRVTLAAVSGVVGPRYRFEVRNAAGDLTYARDWATGRSTWWTPTAAGTYTAKALVRSNNGGSPTEQTLAYTVNAKLSAVSVQVADATPTVTGIPITFAAAPTGGGTVEFRPLIGFRTSLKNAITWDQTRPWGTTRLWTFTPAAAGYYYLRVYAREHGSPAYYDVTSADLALTLTHPPVTGFSITCDPPAGAPFGSPLTITAGNLVGGHAVEWMFWIRARGAGSWTLLQDYGTSPTVSVPGPLPLALAYDIMVYAREVGSAARYDLSLTRTYTVTPITKTNAKDGSVLIYVPAGQFIMGYPGAVNDPNSPPSPQRIVYLDGYWIMRDEVTVRQYRQFCTATGRAMPTAPSWGWSDSHPIVRATWENARAYAAWAGLALPTEAQWEKAARGTDGRVFPWGDMWRPGYCANAGNSIVTQHVNAVPHYGTWPVGSFTNDTSPFGCRDMAGNAREWCADWYGPYNPAALMNPLGPATGSDRTIRAGSWSCSSASQSDFTAFARIHLDPAVSSNSIGFRCVSKQ